MIRTDPQYELEHPGHEKYKCNHVKTLTPKFRPLETLMCQEIQEQKSSSKKIILQ